MAEAPALAVVGVREGLAMVEVGVLDPEGPHGIQTLEHILLHQAREAFYGWYLSGEYLRHLLILQTKARKSKQQKGQNCLNRN